MDNFEDFLSNLLVTLRDAPLRGKEIASEKFDNSTYRIYVDTCFANDTGKFETAIQVNDDNMVIVEEYNTEEAAAAGHKFWVNTCKQEKFLLKSIQNGKEYLYII